MTKDQVRHEANISRVRERYPLARLHCIFGSPPRWEIVVPTTNIHEMNHPQPIGSVCYTPEEAWQAAAKLL